mmetsp:Transcript_22974/g.26211  ORF Transcript_22974/g.26211 Transcript_22974/m.26211 type:complete len:83 (+) Transcript_22974:189-437(+)
MEIYLQDLGLPKILKFFPKNYISGNFYIEHTLILIQNMDQVQKSSHSKALSASRKFVFDILISQIKLKMYKYYCLVQKEAMT